MTANVVKIDKPIVGYKVKGSNDESTTIITKHDDNGLQVMNETFERPELLIGSTYKVKPPIAEHALYVTINDAFLNEGTAHEVRRPFEIFINSKNMDHFQWIVALTRIISAVFRKGGDVTFLVEELKSVFDPRGGYFKKGGRYIPSLVAEIGDIIEMHMYVIGLLKLEELDERQKQFIEEKRRKLAVNKSSPDLQSSQDIDYEKQFPNATVCKKCGVKAVVMDGGCSTCLSCADSRC